MKQLFLSIVAVGLLATASWAGSEVEAPMPITPEHEVACTYVVTGTNTGNVYTVTASTCDEARAAMIALMPTINYLEKQYDAQLKLNS